MAYSAKSGFLGVWIQVLCFPVQVPKIWTLLDSSTTSSTHPCPSTVYKKVFLYLILLLCYYYSTCLRIICNKNVYVEQRCLCYVKIEVK